MHSGSELLLASKRSRVRIPVLVHKGNFTNGHGGAVVSVLTFYHDNKILSPREVNSLNFVENVSK